MTEKRFKEAHLPDKNGSASYPNLVNPEPVKNLYPKKLAFLLFISFTLITFTSNAKNYYIAASGSDANTGLSAVAPWKTIAKINTSFSTFLAGDSILFKCGDTFYGTITIAKTGTSGHPLVFSSYGTGARPVVTGFTTISGWTNEGSGIYSKVITSAALTNMVTIDGVQYAMGRYPDASYLSYETFSTNTSITDNTLGTATNWAGAEAVIRKNDWTIDRTQITNHASNTLTYTSLGTTSTPISNNFGYFIQNDLRTLTTYGEWYHNITTGKFYMYFGAVDPTTKTVKFASTNYVISNAGFDYITIDNINLSGSINDAVHFTGVTDYCNIQNCDISFAGKDGINIAGGSGDLINADNVSKINGLGIVSDGTNTSITNNTVLDIGLIAGQVLGSGGCNGIYSPGNNVVIRNNTVRRIGATGIVLKYSGAATLQYNLVDSACMTFDDGGGIYTSGPDAGARLIDHNIILNTVGNSDGTPDNVPISAGIYLDEQATNVTVSNNSIANINYAAIKFHKAHEDALTDNSFFNNKYGIGFFNDGGSFIRNISVRRNISVAKTAAQQTLRHQSSADDVALFGTADSNYYLRPVDDNLSMSISQPSTGTVTKSLSTWQVFTNQDALSKKSPKTVTDINDLRFEYNASGTTRIVSLGAVSYLDAKGASYTGSVTIPAWGSLVLIANGAAPVPNQLPLANAGSDKIITLPTNSVTLTGAGTDADGTISSYAWAKIAGPSAGTIATTGAATTAVNNLTQGTYQYQLLVTDNKGATAKDTIQVTVNPAPNQRPIATIGADKLITLPTNSTSITGSATDVDGTISSYAWVKISGPSAGTIVNASSATTTVSNLVQGIYKFELTATDNSGAIAKDTLTVTVNAAPVVNAGADKLISLPTNTITLSGIATDVDGTISSYSWVKVSGPSSFTIGTASTASTSINNLVQGVYQFELTATDNTGATSKDTVIVTVNATPVVNAGADKLISLPTNTITLSGIATDADGTISSYSWVKISGSSATISTSNAASSIVNNLVQGIYQFELTVTDNNGAVSKDTVIVTVNAAPAVNAGADKLISLPTNTITLIGTATDADGTISSYSWAKVSGPSSVTISTANAATTTVNNLTQGVYQFELSVTDNNGAVSKDTVIVTVNAKPLVNAGADKLISLPINTTTLTGMATDADGTISSYSWVKISGSSATISTSNAASTIVNNLVQGIYQFELTVTDNNGAVSKDTVIVTVNAAPAVNAGADKLISLPTNTITLIGTATDADGTISSYSWAKVSGPSSVTIATANAATTTVNNLTQGVYQFELSVTDNNGAVSKDTIIVTVNAKPLVNAGLDKLISLPINTTTLTGMATDADGTISSYSWVKISGSSATISTSNAASTIVNNLVQGIYQFELTVTDNNGAVSKDTVIVTVNAAPVVNAGADKLISLPTNTITLSGTATDSDGTISSYSWAKISGPSSVTIATANASTTAVSNLSQGIYQFELTASDNNGAVSKDTVQVTVNAAPLVNAGLDKLISLPINTTTLSGTATDSDGTISSYSWAKISGPSSVTIATANASTTAVNNLSQGIYQFELTASDNNGAVSKDTVQVTVNAAPLVNAGLDKLISLPTNTTTLSGTATDADGTISSYSWAKISGPSSVTIATANAATTAVNNLSQGIYQFELTASDNNGAVSKDTVQVTVNAAPLVNAGLDKLISLPINTTTLSGTATDADGTISSYSWAKISGPSSVTISTANAATTTVNNLAQGVYQFELTVTDNNGAVSKDTLQVTVNAAPVANAGTDNIISLPTNNITLTGTATDVDGTISNYSWAKISGPSSGIIVTINGATTVVNNLVQGVYQYELTVTDNNGSTGKDTVAIIVNAAPVANAGSDTAITLPANTVNLTGSATDTDGAITGYSWIQISGPSSGTITNGNTATAVLSGLVQGVYQYELTVTDNNGATGIDTIQITVNAVPNVAPIANAGVDNIINLPTNTVTLSGYGTDADGTVSIYAWVKISGPSSGTIATPNNASTVLNNLVQGVYQYELTVTDNNGAIGKDTMQLIVNVALNAAPVANAGVDKVMNWPVNTTNLIGSGTDADGTIAKYAWVKIAGPASGKILASSAAATTINSLVQGTYQYELTVTDNKGTTAKDTVQVIVNTIPVANAGSDTTITLPVNTSILTSNSTDSDGTIGTYSWVKISGPNTGKIVSANAGITVINSLVAGIYQYQLTVKDNNGATAKDTVQVTVNAAPNQAPVSNAGADKMITLPTNNTTLTGKGTDADGTISVYSWLQISGPSSGNIASQNAATTVLNGLTEGVYQYELTVTDNSGAKAKDTVQVTVNAALNLAPKANAGADNIIVLPSNSAILSGIGTDADGTVTSYGWVKISGPVSGTIAGDTTATAILTDLADGTYQYELTVKDNSGAIGKDTVMLSVNAAPVANAGVDKVMNWPVNTTNLIGSGTDADGTIAKYAWVKIAGPASGKILASGARSTTINSLVQGTYQYELTVTDNKGTTAKDTVLVIVNTIPVANAGNDTLLTLPVNTSILTSSSTDMDGTISKYAWIKISGPATGKIVSTNAATTVINSLVAGIYKYQLTVTDNNGATAKDTVQVIVNAASAARTMVSTKVLALPVAPVTNELKVYPNPVNDIANLNITTNGNTKLRMSVTDMSGRMVKSGEISNPGKNQTFKLNISDLQDGYYIISVTFPDGQMLNSKILKYGGK